MGNILTSIFLIPLIYLLACLPMSVLYFKSSGLYYFTYYILGYRKKVVIDNLRKSFPDKSENELASLSKQFYRHFCDIIFETIKNAVISEAELKKRCVFTTQATEIFNEYSNKKQSVVAVLGHCGNWEWNALAYSVNFKQPLLGVYHPLSNKTFNSFIYKWRTRFGATIISLREFYPFLIANKNKTYTIGLIADQSPPPESATWLTFLNQATPVFNGPVKIARKFNYPLVYVHVKKTGRGYYVLDVKKISEAPASESEDTLTAKHVQLLEENIKQQPYTWLWSHKRWKHRRPAHLAK